MGSYFCCLTLFLSVFWQTAFGKANEQKDYNKTKYPIVMVAGALAFDNILGGVDYWYGITDKIREAGGEVYVTNLSGAAPIVSRGQELLGDVGEILALTGAEKINLIAHSQGATAARYVAHMRPEWVASISCFHCMNEGTQVADGIYDYVSQNGIVKKMAAGVMSTLFSLVEVLSFSSQDGDFNSRYRGRQMAEDLVISGGFESHRAFNEKVTAGLAKTKCHEQLEQENQKPLLGDHIADGVAYYSSGGYALSTRGLDPLDNLLIPAFRFFMPKGVSWDGLVPACGQPLGKLIEGNYPLNHFDAINQSFGLVASGVSVPTLYAMHVNRLKNAGY